MSKFVYVWICLFVCAMGTVAQNAPAPTEGDYVAENFHFRSGELPGGLAVTLIDPDTVTETNCVRQPFCRTEIGLPKAIVLAHRINLFWGLDWQGMQATIQQLKRGSDVDIIIGCVDSRKARRAIDKWVLSSRVLYWLDLGNNASSGQFILGQPKNSANRKKKCRLPTV